MTSEKNHIGSNFDDFLKEENIEISEEEIREQIENILKDRCLEFLRMKLELTSEHDLKERIIGILQRAIRDRIIESDYKIKKTKLPRKLKKKYKKEQRICFDVGYRQPQRIEFAIPIEESEDENGR